MPAFSLIDIAVLMALAAVATYPTLLGIGRSALSAIHAPPRPVQAESSATGGPEGWVETLLEMKADLERSGKNPEAVVLVRQLIWQLIGGGPTP